MAASVSSAGTGARLWRRLRHARTAAPALLVLILACSPSAPGSSPDCVEEGSKFSAREATLRCCDGLVRIEAYRKSKDPDLKLGDLARGCEPAGPPDIKVCTRCGDGACGSGENSCNCPDDCSR